MQYLQYSHVLGSTQSRCPAPIWSFSLGGEKLYTQKAMQTSTNLIGVLYGTTGPESELLINVDTEHVDRHFLACKETNDYGPRLPALVYHARISLM